MDKTKLHIWHIVNPPAEPSYEPVETPEQAVARINELAQADLKNASVWMNAFGLVEWDGDEWVEWYNEDGMDIREYEEFLEEVE